MKDEIQILDGQKEVVHYGLPTLKKIIKKIMQKMKFFTCYQIYEQDVKLFIKMSQLFL